MNVLTHAQYGDVMNSRMPSIWTKLLIITPIMEVLPLLILGATYLNRESQRPYIYTNMIWSFFAAVVIQCLVSIQGI